MSVDVIHPADAIFEGTLVALSSDSPMPLRAIRSWPIWRPGSWSYKTWADAGESVSAVAVVVLGGCVTLSDQNHKPPFVYALAAAGIGVVTAKIASKVFEYREKREREEASRSLASRATTAILESMHRFNFRSEGEEDSHKNRVTLFRCVEADVHTGRGKHLAIFARYGVRRSSSTTWPLDDEDPEGCRGAAGRAWYHEATVIVRAESDWNDESKEAQEAYARSQGITVEEAASLQVKSRVVVVAPVAVRGRKWGVLVLDSLTGDAVPPANSPKLGQFKAMFNHYAGLIGRCLEESAV